MKQVMILLLSCLLMLMLGPTTADAEWVHRYGFRDNSNKSINALVFLDDNRIVFSRGSQLIEWSFKTGHANTVDDVSHYVGDIAVPQYSHTDPQFFLHTVQGSIEMRRISDLGYIKRINTPGYVNHISFVGGHLAVCARYTYTELDVFFTEIKKTVRIFHSADFVFDGGHSDFREIKRISSRVRDLVASREPMHIFAVDGDSNIDLWYSGGSAHYENPRNKSPMTAITTNTSFSSTFGLAVGTSDGIIYLYRYGNHVHTDYAHTGKVNVLENHPNMGFYASGGNDGIVRVWSFSDYNYRETLTGGSRVTSIGFFECRNVSDFTRRWNFRWNYPYLA